MDENLLREVGERHVPAVGGSPPRWYLLIRGDAAPAQRISLETTSFAAYSAADRSWQSPDT